LGSGGEGAVGPARRIVLVRGQAETHDDVPPDRVRPAGAGVDRSGGRGGKLKPLLALLTLGLALGLASVAGAFTPTDPFVPRQWYLAANHTYDAWPSPPEFSPVRIAIVDSGVDAGHPELEKHIVAARSFVGGSARVDTDGHGTFVAGLIAAEVDDAVGIAGSFPAAQLVVAKAVGPDGTIPEGAEAKAIRWAVAERARVINLSFGGLRDPKNPTRDTYSSSEADAVAYAVAHGVVVVAAVGNGDQAPREPWPFASYPAALPHVLGVSAYARDGAIPDFSNRDAVLNDIAAPGQGILSTFPRNLTADRPGCPEQGYSSCGPEEFRVAEGTSFAAPQVAAAAAMLISLQPSLTSDQVTTLLERSAADMSPATGCDRCPVGRDALSGWGRLDVASAVAALDRPPPAPDSLEPNDGLGNHAATLWGSARTVEATIDYWDDSTDVYRVRLARGQSIFVLLSGPVAPHVSLELRRPGATSLAGSNDVLRRARRRGLAQQLYYRATTAGFYYLEVAARAPTWGAYRLQLAKS
jgi:subtilisin family serine protease